MIEVKIARNLVRDGVEGVRWVLVDPLEALPGTRPAASPSAGLAGLAGLGPQASTERAAGEAAGRALAADAWRQPAAPFGAAPQEGHESAPRQALMLAALKTVVVALALGAAMATAWRVIGPPRWPGDGAASGVRPVGPASPANPSASAPTVTAWDNTAEGQR